MDQYEEQHKHIQRILQIYENDPENFGELFDALQQVKQSALSYAQVSKHCKNPERKGAMLLNVCRCKLVDNPLKTSSMTSPREWHLMRRVFQEPFQA